MTPIRISAIILFAVATAPTEADQPTITRDVRYSSVEDPQLTFDVCKPDAANGAAVLYMVSGGWYSRRFDPAILFPKTKREKNLFGKLVDAGFTLVMVRHRSAPRFKVPDAVGDVRRATRFLRQHAEDFDLDSERFGAMGGSAGGHLSLMLGTADDANPAADRFADESLAEISDRVQAVVAYFPPTDIRPILGFKKQFPALDFDPVLAESVSPLAYVTDDDAPTLLVHGTEDRLVPLISSQAMLLAMQAARVPVQLLTLEGAGHGFEGDASKEAANAAVDWFTKHLVPQPADDTGAETNAAQ